MKKKIILFISALAAAVLLTACTGEQKTSTPAPSQNETTQETTKVTTQIVSEETTTTSAPTVDPKAHIYTGNYNELMAQQRCSMTVNLTGDTYDIELNIANVVNIKDAPLGIYKAQFKYADIKDSGNGLYTVTATAASESGVACELTIIFYGEDNSITGASLNIGKSGLELIKGRPAEN